jgi:hypothetical protein
VTTAAVIVGALLLLAAVVPLVMIGSRHTALRRRVGSFDCAVRASGRPDAVSPGVAQYATGRLLWWQLRSLSLRPARVFSRSELVVLDRQVTGRTDATGDVVLRVRCTHRGQPVELQMSRAACSGLVSWLEAAPRSVGRVV